MGTNQQIVRRAAGRAPGWGHRLESTSMRSAAGELGVPKPRSTRPPPPPAPLLLEEASPSPTGYSVRNPNGLPTGDSKQMPNVTVVFERQAPGLVKRRHTNLWGQMQGRVGGREEDSTVRALSLSSAFLGQNSPQNQAQLAAWLCGHLAGPGAGGCPISALQFPLGTPCTCEPGFPLNVGQASGQCAECHQEAPWPWGQLGCRVPGAHNPYPLKPWCLICF